MTPGSQPPDQGGLPGERKLPEKGGLTHLKPRDTRAALAMSSLNSRKVLFLRWILPLGVLGLFSLLVLWPVLGVRKLESVVTKAVPNLMVENLKLSGQDANGQPYSVTSSRALQAGGSKNWVDLEKPEGEMALKGGAWLSGRAAYGRYDQTGKKLWLGGNVQLFHDDGTQITTDEAQIDLNKNMAWGAQPVLIQGTFGEIRGQGFRVLEGGSVIVIEGPSSAKLDLKSASGPAKEPKASESQRSVNKTKAP